MTTDDGLRPAAVRRRSQPTSPDQVEPLLRRADDAQMSTLVTAVGRVQLTLDVLTRQVERIEQRLGAIEQSMGIAEPATASRSRLRDRGPQTSV